MLRGLHAGEAFEQVGSLFTTEEFASAVFCLFFVVVFLLVLRGALRVVAFLTSAFLARSLDPFQSRHRRKGKKGPSMLSLQGLDGSSDKCTLPAPLRPLYRWRELCGCGCGGKQGDDCDCLRLAPTREEVLTGESLLCVQVSVGFSSCPHLPDGLIG